MVSKKNTRVTRSSRKKKKRTKVDKEMEEEENERNNRRRRRRRIKERTPSSANESEEESSDVFNKSDSSRSSDGGESGDEYVPKGGKKTIKKKKRKVPKRATKLRTGDIEKVGRRGKSKKKKKPSSHPIIADEDEDTIFASLREADVSVKEIVHELVKDYEENSTEVIAKLIEFVFHSAGCTKAKFEREDTENEEIAPYIQKFINIYPEVDDYPIISRNRGFSCFCSNFSEFWKSLINDFISIIEEDPFFLTYLSTWLTSLSYSAHRAFRHTSTLVLYKIMEALVAILHNKRENLGDIKKRTERKMKKRYKKMKKTIRDLDEIVEKFFKGVFVHRYKDTVPEIRALSMTSLKKWVIGYRTMFCENQYLKYFGWELYDNDPSVRLVVIQSLIELYEDDRGYHNILSDFTNKFIGRIVEIALKDVSIKVSVECIKFLTLLLKFKMISGHENEEEFITEIENLIFDSTRSVRYYACEFVLQNLNKRMKSKYGKEKIYLPDLVEFLKKYYEDCPECVSTIVDNFWDQEKKCQKRFTKWTQYCNRLLGNEMEDEETIRRRKRRIKKKRKKKKKKRRRRRMKDGSSSSSEDDFDNDDDDEEEDDEEEDDVVMTGARKKKGGDNDEDLEIAVVIDLFLSSVKKLCGDLETPSSPADSVKVPKKRVTQKMKEKQEEMIIEMTETIIPFLPQVIAKYSADEEKVVKLLQIPRYFNLELLDSSEGVELHFKELLKLMKSIFWKHNNPELFEVIAETFKVIIHSSPEKVAELEDKEMEDESDDEDEEEEEEEEDEMEDEDDDKKKKKKKKKRKKKKKKKKKEKKKKKIVALPIVESAKEQYDEIIREMVRKLREAIDETKAEQEDDYSEIQIGLQRIQSFIFVLDLDLQDLVDDLSDLVDLKIRYYKTTLKEDDDEDDDDEKMEKKGDEKKEKQKKKMEDEEENEGEGADDDDDEKKKKKKKEKTVLDEIEDENEEGVDLPRNSMQSIIKILLSYFGRRVDKIMTLKKKMMSMNEDNEERRQLQRTFIRIKNPVVRSTQKFVDQLLDILSKRRPRLVESGRSGRPGGEGDPWVDYELQRFCFFTLCDLFMFFSESNFCFTYMDEVDGSERIDRDLYEEMKIKLSEEQRDQLISFYNKSMEKEFSTLKQMHDEDDDEEDDDDDDESEDSDDEGFFDSSSSSSSSSSSDDDDDDDYKSKKSRRRKKKKKKRKKKRRKKGKKGKKKKKKLSSFMSKDSPYSKPQAKFVFALCKAILFSSLDAKTGPSILSHLASYGYTVTQAIKRCYREMRTSFPRDVYRFEFDALKQRFGKYILSSSRDDLEGLNSLSRMFSTFHFPHHRNQEARINDETQIVSLIQKSFEYVFSGDISQRCQFFTTLTPFFKKLSNKKPFGITPDGATEESSAEKVLRVLNTYNAGISMSQREDGEEETDENIEEIKKILEGIIKGKKKKKKKRRTSRFKRLSDDEDGEEIGDISDFSDDDDDDKKKKKKMMSGKEVLDYDYDEVGGGGDDAQPEEEEKPKEKVEEEEEEEEDVVVEVKEKKKKEEEEEDDDEKKKERRRGGGEEKKITGKKRKRRRSSSGVRIDTMDEERESFRMDTLNDEDEEEEEEEKEGGVRMDTMMVDEDDEEEEKEEEERLKQPKRKRRKYE